MNHPKALSRPAAPRGGFTIVELIIALVILSVGILAVAALMANSIWQVRRADDLTNSTLAAQQVLDGIAMLDFDSVAEGSFADTISFGPANYIVQWTVEDVSDSLASEDAELKLITVLAGGGLTQTNAVPFELFIYSPGGAS